MYCVNVRLSVETIAEALGENPHKTIRIDTSIVLVKNKKTTWEFIRNVLLVITSPSVCKGVLPRSVSSLHFVLKKALRSSCIVPFSNYDKK